ncbi:hypothetical protein F5Y16DRAFT_397793 [Xylariaceae sp. FL0255]|nr:hypothetical protein F5Y16DRAFT_397793 [Xylariaceae sp. FL0255]
MSQSPKTPTRSFSTASTGSSPKTPTRSFSTASTGSSPEGLSRSPSAASMRSAVRSRSGSLMGKNPTFICRHNLAGSRLNTVLSQLDLQLKTRKCYECQTATPDGVVYLIDTMITSPGLDILDTTIVRNAAQLLFDRLAGQRKNVPAGFKDRWCAILLTFALFCYLKVPTQELSMVCQNVKLKYGAGVDRELLRALVEAAARRHKVWDRIEPTSSPLFSSLNAFIGKVREKVGSVESFAQVKEMF